MSNSAKAIAFSVLAVFMHSCDDFPITLNNDKPEDNGDVIARVYDTYLYANEVQDLVPENASSEDSASIVNNYIQLWAKQQLLISKAEYNLSQERKDFKQQIEDYRNDLLTFAYKQDYVSERLDTSISLEEIKEYYNVYAQNFQLKQNIVRVDYLVIDKNAPELKKAKNWFKAPKEGDLKKLLSYSQKYARDFSFGDTAWKSFDEITERIPLETYNQVDFLRKNKMVELNEGGLLYLLKIKEYKISDSNSPLPYVSSIIKNIILNQRKTVLLERLEKNLLDDALSKNEFETY